MHKNLVTPIGKAGINIQSRRLLIKAFTLLTRRKWAQGAWSFVKKVNE